MFVVFSLIKVKLDSAARVTLVCFGLTFMIRLAMWILIIAEIETVTGSQVLEFLVSLSGYIITISLYYFTLEMESAKILIESVILEQFT